MCYTNITCRAGWWTSRSKARSATITFNIITTTSSITNTISITITIVITIIIITIISIMITITIAHIIIIIIIITIISIITITHRRHDRGISSAPAPIIAMPMGLARLSALIWLPACCLARRSGALVIVIVIAIVIAIVIVIDLIVRCNRWPDVLHRLHAASARRDNRRPSERLCTQIVCTSRFVRVILAQGLC